MDASEREGIAAAVRAGASAVVVGGPEARASAAALAVEADGVVVDVAAQAPRRPWAGLALVVDAIEAVAPGERVPLALDAVRSAVPVGDHLGLAHDLCALLASAAGTGSLTLLVRDAHLMDLSSAAAISHAVPLGVPGVRLVATQAAGDRGVHGIQRHVVPGRSAAAPVDEAGGDPGELAAAGAVLDAAWHAEAAGDIASAATWWLEGGRPDRCRVALDRLPAGSHPEAEARLALATASARRWCQAIHEAALALEPAQPLRAARLLLLSAAAEVSRGDDAAARGTLHRARRCIDRASDERSARAVLDLHQLVTAGADLAGGVDPDALLQSVDRPLARLGGMIDPDAVRLLASAAMPLGWGGHLTEARALLDRLVGVLDARRRFLLLPHPLAMSAWLARRRSRVEVALGDGTRAIELGRLAGNPNDVRLAVAEVAHVEALQGRLESCRAHVAELIPPGAQPQGPAQIAAVSALAVGELLADRPDAAVELLEPVQARFWTTVPPARTAWRHNLVEAYIRTGRRADAEAVLADLEAWCEHARSPREQGQVAWCRGMLAAPGAHDEHFATAVALLAPYPALRWRCELHRLRRLLNEGRTEEATPLAARLVDEAPEAGVPAGLQVVQRLREAHGLVPTGGGAAGTQRLSVDDLRMALAMAEGSDDDEIAARFHRSAHDIGAARGRVLGALGLSDPEQLRRLIPLERSDPGTTVPEVRVLGPTLVARGTGHTVPPPGRPATLLALVAVEGSVPVDRVLDLLWPDDDPGRARPRLRNVLARLRAAVGSVVRRDGELLVLEPDVVVDAHRFESLADAALRAPDGQVEARAGEALAAWTGAPLPAWPYDDWAMAHRDRLLGRCVALFVRRSEARAETVAALEDLEHALALNPLDTQLWQRSISIAEADGRTAWARRLRQRAAANEVELG